MSNAVEARGLTKRYKGAVAAALDDVSFHVAKGEIFGLIGADGAGKTTAFQILAGVMPQTSGDTVVHGGVGYVTQRFTLYADLSVAENIRYAAGLHQVAESLMLERKDRYLRSFGMLPFQDRLAGRLSGGMKQKLALTCALVTAPEILLLDEPTTGVDPVSRREFWDVLLDLSKDGLTIVVATPYLDEAERCHRIAFLDRGRIVTTDTPARFAASDGTLESALVRRLEEIRGPSPEQPFPQRHAVATGDSLLEAKGLEKRFGSFTAVRGFGVTLRRGEVYGLVGSNGAGKTTAIKMMCGLLEPTRGSVSLLGRTTRLRSADLRQRIGYMSQKFTLYDDLTIAQNLAFYADLYGVPRHLQDERKRWALEISELAGRGDMVTAELPGGWKQRVAFGAAILHEPDLIFLDEPTSGVDPVARRGMWRMIHGLAETGAAILVVTHYMEEAEQCTRVGFMMAGELVADGPPREIRERNGGATLDQIFFDLVRSGGKAA